MDFDSSAKFISSLAKFLQSLCNGYVEFNNGVEVIGHIYINVDTGNKIDYVLNEKVCKTDENSVTFISNSFHAQPAEKPKQPEKPPKVNSPHSENVADSQQDEIIIMDEPESDNIGTVPLHEQHQKKRPLKRSQGFSSGHRQESKFSRTDQSSGHNSDNTQLHSDSLHSEHSSLKSAHFSGNSGLTAETDTNMSHLSNVFPQSFSDPSSTHTKHERDIKPQLDEDLKVVNVKQEYDPSHQGGEEDPEGYDDSQGTGGAYPGMQYDEYYVDGSAGGQGPDYSQMGTGAQGDFYHGGAGMSRDGNAGDSAGPTSAFTLGKSTRMPYKYNAEHAMWKVGRGCPVKDCPGRRSKFKGPYDLFRHWNGAHRLRVSKYQCSICQYTSKARAQVYKHSRIKHGRSIIHEAVVQEVTGFNIQCVEPYPYTLEQLFGQV